MQVRSLNRIMWVTTLVLLLTGAHRISLLDDSISDDFEGAPVLCPQMLPPIDGHYSSMTGITFNVQKWQQPAGAEVPFRPHTFSLTTRIQPVLFGQGWYEVFPKETQYEGKTWYWQASSGVPGVLASCTRTWTFFYGWVTRVAWMGPVWGHAFPSDFEPTTVTRLRPGMSGLECWELVLVGYDSYGAYYEIVLDSWCNPVFEE
ncbi:hypothetical protein Strain138_000487 [Pseudogemmatithrix spongiicola]|uniref:Uncharacterized protein n=1 Tax=Pseudogemmatithrix spongiicola TaxID=3062599 RepID=A0AA49JY53_9BACT|nr:hypothetical protein Strain138_000487 [Gemmatimonadaceae bacterium 'strain 138']WKW14161.1 hypothetical protein Strain318_000487 [Gemmatimonadaceae bacterium 'strain 318']